MTLYKLGKKPKRFDHLNRTLQLRNYIAPAQSPKKKDWLAGIPSVPMYDNDTLGDCIIAMMAHMLDQWSYLTTGKVIGFTDAQIIEMYSAIGGYVPGDPSTDNGCDMLTAMNYWRNTGFCGYKIEGYVEANPMSPVEFARAIDLFGNTAIGIELPTAIQTLSNWPAPPNLNGDWAPGSWGGHAIPASAYFPDWQTVETWGATLQMADLFFKAYCDELYVVFFPGWVMADGKSPSGLNMKQLQADLAAL